jgi:hypothetical protein
MSVIPISGAPIVAQPMQPVHYFTTVQGLSTIGIEITLTLFPVDVTGFRTSQFVGSYITTEATNNSVSLAKAISQALQGTTGISTFTYMFGSSSASVTAGEYTQNGANIIVVLPSK